jgi:exodeoxyribonuclease V beta subunit
VSTPSDFDVAATPLESGITLLEASAGTGKTYSLTGIVVRLLLEEKIDRVDQVLLVTFTNAATVELRNRLRSLLRLSLEVAGGADPGSDPILQWVARHASERAARILRLALLQFDRVRVQTLHSFCAQLLRESAFEAGFTFDSEEAGDADALLRQAVEDQWRARMQDSGPWWPALAAVEGWTPEAFLRDVREQVLHPDAVIRPTGPRREEVDAVISSAVATLAADLDPALMRAALEGRQWKKDAVLNGELVGRLLDEIDASQDRAAGPSIEVWLRVRPEALETSLYSRHWKKIRDDAWLEPLRQLETACALARHALRLDLLTAAEIRFARAKERAQRLDFDDLVERVRAALHDPVTARTLRESARDKIRVALIDEFQDTDLRQWGIFHALFGDGTMMLVGDPKQAIYGFRGADVYAYLKAMAQADRTYTLPRNHRSHPDLVAAVNHLFSAGSDPFVVDRIRFTPADAAMRPEDRSLEGDDRPALLLHLLESGNDKPLSRTRATEAVLNRLTDEVQGLLASRPGIDDEKHVASRRSLPRWETSTRARRWWSWRWCWRLCSSRAIRVGRDVRRQPGSGGSTRRRSFAVARTSRLEQRWYSSSNSCGAVGCVTASWP